MMCAEWIFLHLNKIKVLKTDSLGISLRVSMFATLYTILRGDFKTPKSGTGTAGLPAIGF